jgi:hypothetical protein
VQLEERRLGNAAYQKQQFGTALHHYQRALAVVNFVVGQSPHDQAEVDHNKATVLLNMAAVHMALKVSCKQPEVQWAQLAECLYMTGLQHAFVRVTAAGLAEAGPACCWSSMASTCCLCVRC